MDNLYDVVIVGGGPAGLTAALYLARAKYRVLVLEKEQFGGQIAITHEVVNYPGIAKTSGKALTDTIQQQAESFGAEFTLADATGFDLSGDIKTVHTSKGDYRCFGILLATGAHPRTVGFKGEEEHKGRGVAYCATCDAEFFTGKEIFVVGGGYAAAEESVFLTKFARHVTILVRRDDFSCAASVADQAKNHQKITVLTNTALAALSDKLELEVCDRQAQETFAPCVEVCFADSTPTGLAFHGVPSGHEFTSLVLGLYSAAGPGQAIDGDIQQEIAAITKPTDIKILVSLSCTMCPDLVVAAQKIAAMNPNVTAHVYDIRHFEDLKNRYKVMSVPCLVMGDGRVSFGKKNIQQVLDFIGES